MCYQIAVLSGDGIGPEVTAQALNVLEACAKKFGIKIDIKHALIGGAAIDNCGTPLPEWTVKLCQESDAVLLGAVGGGKWDNMPVHLRPERGLLGIRSALELYANLRPAIVHAPLRGSSPLKDGIIGDNLDILIVRELTGGIYFGERGRDENGAFDTERYTKAEVLRITRRAFELAEKRSKKLCSVDKANVMESSRLWRETVSELSPEYPSVTLSHMYVDNAAMQLVRDPHQFDVILTSNLFGDILSDEASMITGSIGLLPSASMGGTTLGLYEPVHGSAPDIAGKHTANPVAAILSCAMLLRYSLNCPEAADCIEAAVAGVLEKGYRTADISNGGAYVSCSEMGKAVVDCIEI